MIDIPEDERVNIKKLQKVKKKETFGNWKKRVFKEPQVEIMIYTPYEPAPHKRMSNLIKESGGKQLKKLFSNQERIEKKKRKQAIIKREEEVTNRLTTFPKDTLVSLLDNYEDTYKERLQQPVLQYFKRYTTELMEDNIDTKTLLSGLIQKYNNAVKQSRKRTYPKK